MTEKPVKRTIATELLALANELFTWGHMQLAPDDESTRPFAQPVGAKDLLLLSDVLPKITVRYAERHDGAVPDGTHLRNALRAIEGAATDGPPIPFDESNPAHLTFAAHVRTEDRGNAPGSKPAALLIEMVVENFDLGVTVAGSPYAAPHNGPNVARLLKGGRRSVRSELALRYYEEFGAAAPAQAIADAVAVLEGMCLRKEPTRPAIRVGRDEGAVVLDLGDTNGRCVVVTPSAGWAVLPRSPILFWRTNATLAMPEPARDGDLSGMRALFNIVDEDWPLVLAWLVAGLIWDDPHTVLLLTGESGSAKTSAATLLSSLIDPCVSQVRSAPTNPEDWAVALAGGWCAMLDNLTTIPTWLSDAICRASTGDGVFRRELYTTDDISILAFRRLVGITTIDCGPLQSDLADRIVRTELHVIPEDKRMPEAEFLARWEAEKPRALGALLDLLVQVLAKLPTMRKRKLPRMADYARVLLAVDEVLGTKSFDRYALQAGTTAEAVADANHVLLAIRASIKKPWTGTAGELRDKLTPERPPKDWPATPAAMGAQLTRHAPTLRKLGWEVERPQRTSRTKPWSLTPPPSQGAEVDKDPSSPSLPSFPQVRDVTVPVTVGLEDPWYPSQPSLPGSGCDGLDPAVTATVTPPVTGLTWDDAGNDGSDGPSAAYPPMAEGGYLTDPEDDLGDDDAS